MAKRSPKSLKQSQSYDHKYSKSLLRPDVGTQAEFRKKKDPKTYRYDPHLDPELSWDINADREKVEELIAKLDETAAQLANESDPERISTLQENIRNSARPFKVMSQPFLNWAGKAENSEFSVPTLPLFVHERFSTKAILESVKKRKRDKQEELTLFADEQLDITDRILKAYEHKAPWTNRLILGDSLVVMNSLLRYESLGGQVQMIYMDPPYGVKFGSNFQPFIRKRDVKHGDDADMTREPEMVKAYRDTWELGLHSYLTYLRDRFLLCRELLHPSGSIFVQIGDENVHHVRELMDEVFGAENFISIINFQKTGFASTALLATVNDYAIWYAKSIENVKYKQLFVERNAIESSYNYLSLPNGEWRRLTDEERHNSDLLPNGSRIFQSVSLQSPGPSETDREPFIFKNEEFYPNPNRHWATTKQGLIKLTQEKRIIKTSGNTLRYKMYLDDYPVVPLSNTWTDTMGGADFYVVQTTEKVISRCLLMTTDPGDLVLDPTCVARGTRVLTPLDPPASGQTPP